MNDIRDYLFVHYIINDWLIGVSHQH